MADSLANALFTFINSRQVIYLSIGRIDWVCGLFYVIIVTMIVLRHEFTLLISIFILRIILIKAQPFLRFNLCCFSNISVTTTIATQLCDIFIVIWLIASWTCVCMVWFIIIRNIWIFIFSNSLICNTHRSCVIVCARIDIVHFLHTYNKCDYISFIFITVQNMPRRERKVIQLKPTICHITCMNIYIYIQYWTGGTWEVQANEIEIRNGKVKQTRRENVRSTSVFSIVYF